MIVDVQNFLAVASPGWPEAVADEKPAAGSGKGYDVNLGVTSLVGGVGNPLCVRRKHRKTSVVFFLQKWIGFTVAKHRQNPDVEMAAVQGFVGDVFPVRGPTAGILIQLVVIEQFLLTRSVRGPCVEINLAAASGVKDNRISIRRPDGIVVSGLRETELRLGSAGQVVDVNLQMPSGVGSRCRNSLSVGRDVRVLESSSVDDITFLAAAVVPGEIQTRRLSPRKDKFAVIRE